MSVMITGAMLSQRHAAERLGTCWHGGGLSLADVRKQMRDALDEFLVAGSGSEVAAVSASVSCWAPERAIRLGPKVACSSCV